MIPDIWQHLGFISYKLPPTITTVRYFPPWVNATCSKNILLLTYSNTTGHLYEIKTTAGRMFQEYLCPWIIMTVVRKSCMYFSVFLFYETPFPCVHICRFLKETFNSNCNSISTSKNFSKIFLKIVVQATKSFLETVFFNRYIKIESFVLFICVDKISSTVEHQKVASKS